MAESTTRLVTYKDMLDHSVDYLGVNVTGDASRDARRCVQSAYRAFTSMRSWTCYYTRGRLTTVAAQTTGTIAFDYTGGANERQLTLTGSSWPSWVPYGTVIIGSVAYEVADTISSTVITLAANSNPGEDVAAGTSYTLYRDTYPMPIDFQAGDQPVGNELFNLNYVHPSQWLRNQQTFTSVGLPTIYSFMTDPNYYGTVAIKFWPAPNSAQTYDFIYKRTPRPLLLDEYKTGTATCTIALDTVVGVGTQWKDSMVGSIIRFSANKTDLPSGLAGANPFQIQRTIVSVESVTGLTVDRVVRETLSGVKYTISDPVDIEDGAMLVGLQREIEKELRISRRMKPAPEEERRYRDAMAAAMENDARSFQPRQTYDRMNVGGTYG